MSSVWVCGCRKAFFTADDITACEQQTQGQCSFVLKPCDAVEYAEVKMGKWVPHILDGHHIYDNCSICDVVYDGAYTNYCPSCGAKMEGNDE